MRAGAERMATRANAASKNLIMGFLTVRITVSELMRKQRPGVGRRLPVGLAPYAQYTGGVASDRFGTTPASYACACPYRKTGSHFSGTCACQRNQTNTHQTETSACSDRGQRGLAFRADAILVLGHAGDDGLVAAGDRGEAQPHHVAGARRALLGRDAREA